MLEHYDCTHELKGHSHSARHLVGIGAPWVADGSCFVLLRLAPWQVERYTNPSIVSGLSVQLVELLDELI